MWELLDDDIDVSRAGVEVVVADDGGVDVVAVLPDRVNLRDLGLPRTSGRSQLFLSEPVRYFAWPYDLHFLPKQLDALQEEAPLAQSNQSRARTPSHLSRPLRGVDTNANADAIQS